MANAPLLGRCKFCDHALFADRSTAVEADHPRDVREPHTVYHLNNGYVARCPNRHNFFVMHLVRGTYNPDTKCDARCQNAKGNDCTCSCGGINHGRGYAVTPVGASSGPSKTIEEIQEGDAPPNSIPERTIPGHLGEIGSYFEAAVSVQQRMPVKGDKILFKFKTDSYDRITWFVPVEYAPDWEVYDNLTIRAKVKAHEDHEKFGKATIVVYVEEI